MKINRDAVVLFVCWTGLGFALVVIGGAVVRGVLA